MFVNSGRRRPVAQLRFFAAARILIVASCVLLVIPLQAPPARAVLFGDNGDFALVQKMVDRSDDLEIVRLGPNGGSPVNLTASGLDQNQPAWSPDGRRLAYWSSGALLTMRADGTGSKLLLAPRTSWMPTSPAWSPDGTKLAYARVYWDPDGERIRGSVHVLDLATGKSKFVAPSGIQNTEIDWSPNGKALVFQHWRYLVADRTWGSHVMVVNRDGSNLVDLTVATGGTHSDWRPSWLNDGRIVFRRYSNCLAVYCPAGFYVVEPDGSGLERLPLEPQDWTGDGEIDTADRLRQSPDGTGWSLLVYDQSVEGHQLWRLNSSMSERDKLFSPIFWYTDWQPRCSVRGTRGGDILRGTSGADLICGLGGDDVIRGRGGNDVIFGHGGRDRLIGGSARDIVVGNAGRDRCDRDERDYSRVC